MDFAPVGDGAAIVVCRQRAVTVCSLRALGMVLLFFIVICRHYVEFAGGGDGPRLRSYCW